MLKRNVLALLICSAVVLAAAFTLSGMDRKSAPVDRKTVAATPFTLVDAAERELDGSPALALTFSEELDSALAYDKYIAVMRLPGKKQATARQEESEEDEAAAEDEEQEADGQQAVGESPGTADGVQEAAAPIPVQGAWVLGDNPRMLYFPHVSPQTRYEVRIVDKTLPDKHGRALSSEEDLFLVDTAAVSPAYYFASKGMVLPARENGGLPVVTVNVPEVDVQFLRVRDDRLPAFLNKVIGSPPGGAVSDIRDGEGGGRHTELRGAVDYWELDKMHAFTESAYVGRFVTESKPNRRAVTFLPVEEIRELARPGVYLAVMSQPGRFGYEYQVTYFYVSDLGLHVRLFPKNADVYLSSLLDGKPIARAEVQWLDGAGRQLARGESDADGRAHFEVRPKGAKVVLARLGSQISMIALKEPALDLSEFKVGGAPGKPVRLFAWSGRDLYRPGEQFDVSVLVRDADGRSLPPLPVQAILKRPDGRKQFTASWTGDAAFAGYFLQKIELPLDAPTGFWSLELRADPADRVPATVFRFGVEEFLPERMKLDLGAQEYGIDPEKPLEIQASGTYLYGAPAVGNRLIGVAQFKRSTNPLEAVLPGFVFGDVNEDSITTRQELPEAKLNEAGQGRMRVDLEAARKRHSPIAVHTTISLLESGGRPVVRSLERVLWPAGALVGIRPLFVGDYARQDAPVQFEVVRAGQDGTLLAAPTLPVRLFRENRHYYWRYDDGSGWNSGFTETDELVATEMVSIAAGQRGGLSLPVQYGRYRLEIFDPESGLTMKYRFYAGWNARDDESQGLRPDKVALKLNKPAYREGRDTVQLTITPPHGGQALITVEGDRTLWVKRIAMPASGTTVSIPVDASWLSHDLYVNVLVLRPGNEGDRVTPARALGIVPLPLERKARGLEVALEAPARVLPEGDMQVQVRVPGAGGKEALLTLSAVDAGILNITNFATPDPFAFFFGQLRYAPDLHDIYGRLIEKMAGRKGRLRYGGDAAPAPTRGLPKKLRLVDLFSGPVRLDAKGEAVVTLSIPDFNGTLRLMAVAATAESYGSAEGEVVVAAPLVAELSTPRFMSAGDEAGVALDLHNLSGAPATLTVRIPETEGLRIHNPERRLSLADGEKAVLRFSIEADPQYLGLADLRVQVAGEGGTGAIRLERSFALQVQGLTPEQQVRRFYELQPGSTITIRENELAGFLPLSVQAHLSVSDTAPLDVRSAVQDLLGYPYGCVEQTTSSTYPHLFVDEEKARSLGLTPFSMEERGRMVAASLAKLNAYQGADGGFSLWGGAEGREYWLTAYVGNFLQDARAQGFDVPADMQKKTMDFLLRKLQEGVAGVSGQAVTEAGGSWGNGLYAGQGRFGVLAYGGYVLARDARAPLSTLRQLFDRRASATSGLALVQLGLALQLMGDEEKGAVAIAEGLQTPRLEERWWGDYGSELRDTALGYALLKRHGVRQNGVDNLLIVLAKQLEKASWLSTQEKLAVFLAADGMARGSGDAGLWQAMLRKNTEERRLASQDSVFLPLTGQELSEGLRLHNNSDRSIFAELVVSGRPRVMPTPQGRVLKLSRQVYTAEGKPFGGGHLRSGSSLIVHVQVKSPVDIANALVVDHIPAGLEIENLNLVQGEGMPELRIADLDVAETMADTDIQHQEFREDRYVAAFKLGGYGDTKIRDLFYRVRVVTPGRYSWPPLYAEDMYRPAVNGLLTGGGITVVEGGL